MRYAAEEMPYSLRWNSPAWDSFLDRLKQSGKSVKFAVAAANIGLVLVATGIHSALIKIAEAAKPNPIPDMQGIGRTASDYWQLFSETAPLTILITFIALLAWPAEQKTRAARNDRELAQAILRKGRFVDEIFVLILAALIAVVFVISIGRLACRISQHLLSQSRYWGR